MPCDISFRAFDFVVLFVRALLESGPLELFAGLLVRRR